MQPKIGNGFWSEVLARLIDKMIPFQLKALKDEVEGAAPSHALENFEIAAGLKSGEFYGCVFQDSDIGKWIEAAAYSLMLRPDPTLEAEIDRIVGIIGKAQRPDGYVDTYFIVKEPENRWKNLRDCHELYCAGHLIEGAVAYYRATGKRAMLDIMCRAADCIYREFGPDGKPGYPGHPEIELALWKLAEVTGDSKYSELAKLMIDRRGTEPSYFQAEMRALGRPELVSRLKGQDLSYFQADRPLREQDKALGHSVRAMYLYSGATDQAAATGDKELIKALDTLWRDVTEKQMYITGGFGSSSIGESFVGDYELPNDTVYSETCAAVAFVFWAKRMLKLHMRGDIADNMERALYNTVLSGSNLACDRYFYVNPLEVVPGVSGELPIYGHVLPERPAWFGCACCPPNMARLILSLYEYAYDYDGSELDIHLFADGTAKWPELTVTETGSYPWDNVINWSIECGRETRVAIRIPGWSRSNTLTCDGQNVPVAENTRDGYCRVTLAPGKHELRLEIELRARRVYANPLVRADIGCTALMRGPITYCFEGVDNGEDLAMLRLPRDSEITCQTMTEGPLSGMTVLKCMGERTSAGETLYLDNPPEYAKQELKAIPYFAWGNRGLNGMRVWIPYV